MSEVVRVERADSIAIVTLNRPEAMNALSQALRRALAAAIGTLDADPEIRVLVLTGAGGRAFCAGLDLKELGAVAGALDAGSADEPEDNPVKAIELCRKPIIGAINGVAITGGFELALACDCLIASTNARFADTHARVGILPGWGLSQRLSRLIGPYRAKELSLTGNFLDAAAAQAWGLVNRVVAPDLLMSTATSLARDMAEPDPRMIAALKATIDEGYRLPLGEGLSLEQRRAREHNASLTPDAIAARREAVQARARRQPQAS